ncbi:hypothetical protein CHS0354_036666 [Potamilus streckersoni]|uniref:SMP-30/Gluconolactonase/LRE-like region domain-containing protein n=1 Tax=Potamilus streckersoni TaxID=2493646 RepID=A0AAE0TH62_9BIVA|nr:hypothetical protein CHS0354_036666 [Potamilus streckersoni]
MTNTEVFQPQFTKIAENIPGSEGPVFDKDGRFFMVAPERTKDGQFAGDILQINLNDGKPSVHCAPVVDGVGGIPAGCQCDKDNNLWVADMRLGILKIQPDGTFQQLCKTDSDGRVMQGCNDCIYDYSGTLWVTAPAGDIAPAPFRRSMEEPFGSVYCVVNHKDVIRIDTNYRFSNGIAVLHSNDGRPKTLIVAETPTKTLWQYDILGPGKVGPKKFWGKLPGDHQGGPDGMDFDEDNNLLVTNHGSSYIEVFSPEGGDPIARIKCPFHSPSNVHFQPHTNIVYVTEHEIHGLWKFEWKRKGKLQYCDTLSF